LPGQTLVAKVWSEGKEGERRGRQANGLKAEPGERERGRKLQGKTRG